MWLHLFPEMPGFVAWSHDNLRSSIKRQPAAIWHEQVTGHALQVWSLPFGYFGEVKIVHVIQGLNTSAVQRVVTWKPRALSLITNTAWVVDASNVSDFTIIVIVWQCCQTCQIWPCFLVVGQTFRRTCGTLAGQRLPLLHLNMQHNLVNFVEVIWWTNSLKLSHKLRLKLSWLS